MNKLILITALLLSANYAVFGQTKEWKTLDEQEYSIDYPATWELNQRGLMGTTFVLLSPMDSLSDQFRANVNLLLQDLTGYNLSLDQYVEISEEQVETMITDGKLISSERVKKDGTEFHKIICNGKQGKQNLTFEQYYWIVKEQAYSLTLTTETSEYENLKTIGEKILDSFKFK